MPIRILILLLSAAAAALGTAIISAWGSSWTLWLLVVLFWIVVAAILALAIAGVISRADRVELNLIKKDQPDPTEPAEGYNNDPRFDDPGTQ
jgi:ABC-type transport system involved in multi-copper enzyme maturation permease subunit